MIRTSVAAATRRAMLGITRGVFGRADDSKKWQEIDIEILTGEKWEKVEVFHPYGHTYVPAKPEKGKEPEAIIACVNGSRSHPIVLGVGDRNHRPKNLKPGESARHDDQKQISKIGRDGISTVGKKVEITGGGERPKGDTKNHELNEFMKGVRAEIAQLKDTHHALFDVVTKLRQNVESVVPALAPVNLATQVTAALNGLPTGLDTMKALAEGKLQDYFQKAAQQALSSFLDPSRILNAASVLGAIEGQIQGLQSQIANLVTNNPVIGLVDDLREELDALASSGGPPEAIRAGTARLQQEISRAIGNNPVVKTVDGLRAQLQTLMDQAGAGLNFLAVQKRAAQGLVKSVKFGP